MEIDLERAKHAVIELGTALDEARQVIRPGQSGHIRIRTEGRVIELPTSWALAGIAAFAVAALASSLPLPLPRSRRRSEEEPLGIG